MTTPRTTTPSTWRRRLVEGLTCGLVSALAVVVVALRLTDEDWHSSPLPIPVLWLAGVVTTAVLAGVVLLLAGRRRSHPVHLLVPLASMVVIPMGVTAGGQARDKWTIAICWAIVVLVVHLALAMAARPVSVRRASLAALAIVVAPTGAVLVERVSQVAWRADDFRAVGVPLVMVDVPGFHAVHAGAGNYSVAIDLADHHRADISAGRTLRVVIEPAWGRERCDGTTDRVLIEPKSDDRLSIVELCLDDPAYQITVTSYSAADSRDSSDREQRSLGPLMNQMTLRPVSAEDLARLPPTNVSEPD
ncbi:hypothetical protein ACWDV4_14330 [Micromonospora sp. NPDC003197]